MPTTRRVIGMLASVVVAGTACQSGGRDKTEDKGSPSPAEQAKTEPAQTSVKPEDMPAKYACTSCHAVDNKLVGPSFKEVAAKYRGQDVEAKLVEKVKNGGTGVWGQVPMPPNPQVPDPDLHAVVKWILSLK